MLPDVAGLAVYLLFFIGVLLYTKGWDDDESPNKPKKKDDNDYDAPYSGDAQNSNQFGGSIGAIEKKWRKDDPGRASLHYAAQIRSHPKHKAAREQLKRELSDKFHKYLREGGR